MRHLLKPLLSALAIAGIIGGYAAAAHNVREVLASNAGEPLNLTLPKSFRAQSTSAVSAQGGALNLTIHYPNGKTVNVTRHWNSFVFDGNAPQTLSIDYTTDTVFCGCFDK
jgi:hypothetical protein